MIPGCFWINLPFGGLSLAVVFFFFKNPERKYSHLPVRERLAHIDMAGAVFLIWSNSKVWGTLLGFGLIIIVFVVIQFYQGDRATIPVRVFKQRTILVSCVFSALLSMALYT
jgi:hypothetical protein